MRIMGHSVREATLARMVAVGGAIVLALQLGSCSEGAEARFVREVKEPLNTLERLDRELCMAHGRLRTSALAMNPTFDGEQFVQIMGQLRREVAGLPMPKRHALVAMRSTLQLFPDRAQAIVESFDGRAAVMKTALERGPAAFESMGAQLRVLEDAEVDVERAYYLDLGAVSVVAHRELGDGQLRGYLEAQYSVQADTSARGHTFWTMYEHFDSLAVVARERSRSSSR